jgi:adenosylcobyric acid synthase
MLAGTGSDVGKSVVATALCRIFLQDGYHPAPFKAQNMALNSYATPDGLEIGRAQAVQAEAAGLPCHTDMNPLLLKPQSDHTSQVVLHGKAIGSRSAYDFWRDREKREAGGEEIDFRAEVCAAFDRLAARYNPIVMEGAGSICELNLKQHDLVNMSMARHAKADVILVADIDRGGVFASAYGSIALQAPDDRRRIKGIVVNKFRGDQRLFDDGRRILEEVCQVPVLGVIPYMNDLHIEGEDSVALEKRGCGERNDGQGEQGITVAVVRLPHISNYTDFDMLEQDSRVHLYYTDQPSELSGADIIFLPGTKATLSDLRWLYQRGLAAAVLRAHREGKSIVGICGGYQMMGYEVLDPQHVEGDDERMAGLGLLPVSTTMNGEKLTRQVTCEFGQGYEIHQGVTRPVGDARLLPLTTLSDGRIAGYRTSAKCMGTYVHGILDNAPFVDFLLQPWADKAGSRTVALDYRQFKEQQYNRLADHVRQHLNIQKLYQILTSND